MVLEPVCCPNCESTNVVKNGKSNEGKQRYRCRNTDCTRASFICDYSYRGHLPGVKQQITEMAMNGSGIRDTARVLRISPTTVIEEQKKHHQLEQVNRALLEQKQRSSSMRQGRSSSMRQGQSPTVAMVVRVAEAEMDEMWSFVQSKRQQRWLWHAIDHQTGVVLAYVLAPHEDAALLDLMKLLSPFGIEQFYTDSWGAYWRLLNAKQHTVGKLNTQRIERKHLTLRTRIKRLTRKTICFSKSIWLHDAVIGLFINRYEFGRAI